MRIKKGISILLALVLTTCLCTSMAFATEQAPLHKHGSTEGASVSQEVDVADNSSPSMSTNFNMYCHPDPVANNLPNMGDMGFELENLLMMTMAVGVMYLATSRFAYQKDTP